MYKLLSLFMKFLRFIGNTLNLNSVEWQIVRNGNTHLAIYVLDELLDYLIWKDGKEYDDKQ